MIERPAASVLRVLATMYALVHWVARVRNFLASHLNHAVLDKIEYEFLEVIWKIQIKNQKRAKSKMQAN